MAVRPDPDAERDFPSIAELVVVMLLLTWLAERAQRGFADDMKAALDERSS